MSFKELKVFFDKVTSWPQLISKLLVAPVVYCCDITYNSVIGTIIQPIYTCYIPNILQHDYIVSHYIIYRLSLSTVVLNSRDW